jgi:hypothetical protein
VFPRLAIRGNKIKGVLLGQIYKGLKAGDIHRTEIWIDKETGVNYLFHKGRLCRRPHATSGQRGKNPLFHPFITDNAWYSVKFDFVYPPDPAGGYTKTRGASGIGDALFLMTNCSLTASQDFGADRNRLGADADAAVDDHSGSGVEGAQVAGKVYTAPTAPTDRPCGPSASWPHDLIAFLNGVLGPRGTVGGFNPS